MEEFSAKAKSKGKEFGFEGFCQIAAKFLTEEDEEKLKEELKEAFRIYDKQVGKIVLVWYEVLQRKIFSFNTSLQFKLRTWRTSSIT